ncbi:hypothetical protein COH20_000845 [Aspergillus flavus]|nr:hypothetical protein COH20_000845 [Aspergillus flavus]RAQ66556.1 hypothetical protein COH21_006406 [Aspergillus flavus]
MDGLLCGIVHDTLKQCPEFTPIVFPEQWEESIRSDWRVPLQFRFSRKDIRVALNTLLHNKELYEKYRLCFFVDGLDECLETCQQDYHDMVNLLLGWVDVAPLDLKLCISSRNYEIFRTAFEDEKRLKLHELTRHDIENFVIHRLKGFEICSYIKSAAQAKQKVLIEHLLTWANPLDRISVYRTFAVVGKLAELGMTPMTLLRYSFLSDYEMNTMFAMHAELSGCELIESDMKTRKTQARARLNDQSRGLIEIKPLPYRGHLLTKPLDIEHVTFIHRSVFDSLQTHHILDIMEACEGLDIVDAMSQIVLAEIKFFGLYSFHSTRLRWNLLKKLPPLLGYCQKEARDASIFRFFDELDHAVLCIQGLSPLQDQQNQLPVYISGTGHFTPSACYFSVFHWVIYTQYVGYLRYKILQDSRLVLDKFQFTHILACIIESIYDTGNVELLRVVEPYLEGFAQGPHMEITYIKGWSQTNILNTALLAALKWLADLSPADKTLYATLLESLLGSTTGIPWAIQAVTSYPRHNTATLQVTIHRSRVYKSYIRVEHQETVQYLMETNKGLSVSLHELVNFWELENASRLKQLLGPKPEIPEMDTSRKLDLLRQSPRLYRNRFGLIAGIVQLPWYISQYVA